MSTSERKGMLGKAVFTRIFFRKHACVFRRGLKQRKKITDPPSGAKKKTRDISLTRIERWEGESVVKRAMKQRDWRRVIVLLIAVFFWVVDTENMRFAKQQAQK